MKVDSQKLLRDYRNGLSLKTIANKWSISIDTIYYHIRKYNVKKRVKHYTEQEVKQMAKFYYSELSLNVIAKKFNVSSDSLLHILKRRGFKFTRRKKLQKIQNNDVPKLISLYKEGYSTTKIAVVFGVTKSTISRWLKRYGIKLHSTIEWNKTRRKKIKPQRGMTKDKALLLGLLLSDGSESTKSNAITLAEYDKLAGNFAIKLVKRLYGISGKIDKDYRRIVWHSENMRDDLHTYAWSIVHHPKIHVNVPEIIKNDAIFACNFLKGYFSCDGSVILAIDKNCNVLRQISLTSKNPYLLEDISDMLGTLDIPHRKNDGTINISTKLGIRKFYKNINILPVIIKTGKNWVGCRKDILLKTLLFTFSKKFNKKWRSKEEGYNYLRSIYNEVNHRMLRNSLL